VDGGASFPAVAQKGVPQTPVCDARDGRSDDLEAAGGRLGLVDATTASLPEPADGGNCCAPSWSWRPGFQEHSALADSQAHFDRAFCLASDALDGLAAELAGQMAWFTVKDVGRISTVNRECYVLMTELVEAQTDRLLQHRGFCTEDG